MRKAFKLIMGQPFANYGWIRNPLKWDKVRQKSSTGASAEMLGRPPRIVVPDE